MLRGELALLSDSRFLRPQEQHKKAFERSLKEAWNSIERVWQRAVERKASVSVILDAYYFNLHMRLMQVKHFERRLAIVPHHRAEECAISSDLLKFDFFGQVAFTQPFSRPLSQLVFTCDKDAGRIIRA